MMKKLLLLTTSACLVGVGAIAQHAEAKLKSFGSEQNAEYILAKPAPSGLKNAKVTATGFREYDHADYLLSVNVIMDSLWACRIWHDSTILQSFTSGPGKINYSSVAQTIFPWDSLFNDVDNPNFLGKIRITSTSTYKVDSVKISGLYLKGNLRSSSIVDTLIISLGQQNFTYSYFTKAVMAPYGDLTPYLEAADKDTLKFSRALSSEPSTRTALSFGTAPARVMWKVPLTDAMRQPSSTATIQTIVSAPQGGSYTINAGNVPVVSFTFKSGDTWVPNVSNIDSFHRFLPVFFGTRKIMPYQGRWVTARDHSASSLMFSTGPLNYTHPAIIEVQNDVDYRYEHLAASMVMSCPTCGYVALSIKENTILSTVNAFPNPSNENFNIEFGIKEKANVVINITNILGQVVASQTISNVNVGQLQTATFNTSNLTSGIYIYTVEANGQRTSNRFTITH